MNLFLGRLKSMSITLPNLFIILGAMLLYLYSVEHKKYLITAVGVNLFLLLEILRFKPWRELSEREKIIARNVWTMNLVWPLILLFFASDLYPHLKNIIGWVIPITIGLSTWYVISKKVSESKIAKVLYT